MPGIHPAFGFLVAQMKGQCFQQDPLLRIYTSSKEGTEEDDDDIDKGKYRKITVIVFSLTQT